MKTKLTLTIEESLITEAKLFAKKNGRSLSEIVEAYLQALTKKVSNASRTSSITSALIGSFSAPDSFEYKTEITKYLSEKYQVSWINLLLTLPYAYSETNSISTEKSTYFCSQNFKMIAANYTEFRTKLKDYLDQVEQNQETLIVKRSKGKGTVIISLEEYNAMMETMHLLGSKANADRLRQSIQQMESGEVVEEELIED